MSHPFLWPGKTFFYPIGNTPAVSLTQDLAPEQDAKILLLGCGDPRNILYTLYATEADSTSLSRNLDFTCCDAEGAVLARNILLFSLLLDNQNCDKIDQIWSIFYHLYIDTNTLLILANQSRKLVALSKDLLTWENGEFGSLLRICTPHTLSDLRRYWILYEATSSFTKNQHKAMRNNFAAGMESAADSLEGRINLTGGRSAGPFSPYILSVVAEQFKRFWRSGTTSNVTEQLAYVNPTFAYSSRGDKFLVHYGTDPLLSFHLAEAFTQGVSQEGNTVSMDDLVSTAKSQFRRWCAAFIRVHSTDSATRITLRFFSGDALALCHALRYCSITQKNITPLHTLPWGVSCIELNRSDYGCNATSYAPLQFNVIETSNIMDHVGLLNVFIAASPLLEPNPSSTLYTEALLPSGSDPFTGILKSVCVDLPMLSLLIGLVPSTFVSHFTTQSNIHEILATRFMKSPQFHERLPWKAAAGGDANVVRLGIDFSRHVVFSPQQLARILFEIYLNMFADENMDTLNTTFQLSFSGTNGQIKWPLIHYTRRTFAELLRVVMGRIVADWTLVMQTLHDLVFDDRSLLTGSNYYQDLICQFHLLDLYSVDTLIPGNNFVSQETINRSITFRGWVNVPTAVCIVLEVPRETIDSIALLLNTAGTPILQGDLRGLNFQNSFSCIQVTYGTTTVSGEGENKTVLIIEDKQPTSPLIVSFWVPTWILLSNSSTKVGLTVRSTPATTSLAKDLGLHLIIYTTTATDDYHVHILADRPNLGGEIKNIAAMTGAADRASANPQGAVVVNMNTKCTKINTLTVRVDVTEPHAQSSLAGGSGISLVQATPCTVHVCVGDHKILVLFPYPVDAGKSKVRVARKSMYLEVIAPLSPAKPLDCPELPAGKFPITMKNQVANLWNVHRLNLDRLPILDNCNSMKLNWIVNHTSLMLSDRERNTQQGALARGAIPYDVMVNVKESLHAIFSTVIGLNAGNPKTSAFALSDPSIGMYTIIFVTDLRLDIASHTIVADAWVLHLRREIMNKVLRIDGDVMQVRTDINEMRAWKQLLPVFTERCRTWRHKVKCEYAVKGKIPLSTEYEESPICTCGQGVSTADFQQVKEWKELAPYVTRAALSPIFPVSYLESVAGFLDPEKIKGLREEQMKHSGCAGCGGEGQPKLMSCSKCRKVSYCSVECQRREWKKHKPQCTP